EPRPAPGPSHPAPPSSEDEIDATFGDLKAPEGEEMAEAPPLAESEPTPEATVEAFPVTEADAETPPPPPPPAAPPPPPPPPPAAATSPAPPPAPASPPAPSPSSAVKDNTSSGLSKRPASMRRLKQEAPVVMPVSASGIEITGMQ